MDLPPQSGLIHVYKSIVEADNANLIGSRDIHAIYARPRSDRKSCSGRLKAKCLENGGRLYYVWMAIAVVNCRRAEQPR